MHSLISYDIPTVSERIHRLLKEKPTYGVSEKMEISTQQQSYTVSTTAPQPTPTTTEPTLRDHVHSAVVSYLRHIDGVPSANLFDIVQEEVEEPLLRAVLIHCRGNQSKAAIILGLSRGTLRKKMRKFGLLD